jgi:hypothetical protein
MLGCQHHPCAEWSLCDPVCFGSDIFSQMKNINLPRIQPRLELRIKFLQIRYYSFYSPALNYRNEIGGSVLGKIIARKLAARPVII